MTTIPILTNDAERCPRTSLCGDRSEKKPGFAHEAKGKQNAEGLAEEDFEVPSYIPELGIFVFEIVGKLLWLARGSDHASGLT